MKLEIVVPSEYTRFRKTSVQISVFPCVESKQGVGTDESNRGYVMKVEGGPLCREAEGTSKERSLGRALVDLNKSKLCIYQNVMAKPSFVCLLQV